MEDLRLLKNYINENKEINDQFNDNKEKYNLKDLWQTSIQDVTYSINVKSSLSNFINEDNYQKYQISQGYFNKYFYGLRLFDNLEKKIKLLNEQLLK